MAADAPTLDPNILLGRIRREINRLGDTYTAFELTEQMKDSALTEEVRDDLTTVVMALLWHRSQIDAILGPDPDRKPATPARTT